MKPELEDYMDKLVNVAFPVFGHHAGLPNRDAMFETFNQCGKEESKWLDVLCALKKDENRNDCLKKNKWLFCFFKSNFPML